MQRSNVVYGLLEELVTKSALVGPAGWLRPGLMSTRQRSSMQGLRVYSSLGLETSSGFQAASVLEEETNLHQRLALESWHIKKHSSFNREAGALSSAYTCLCSFTVTELGCSIIFVVFVLLRFYIGVVFFPLSSIFVLFYTFSPFFSPALVILSSHINLPADASGIFFIPFSLTHKIGLQPVTMYIVHHH